MGRRRSGGHKTDGKLNRAGYKKTVSGFMGTLGAVCITAALACSGIFMLQAQAAPARLRSADAAIYEQANEGSNTVGNLVEGSTFEYVGDVTAEDGSVWHQVTTASGAAGYIKGDREIEAVEEEPVPEQEGQEGAPEGQGNPESQEAPEGEGGNGDTAPEGNGPAEGDAVAEENRDGEADTQAPEGDGGEEGTEDPEGIDGEEPEALEDGQPEDGNPEDGALSADIHGVENRQAKSYALDLSGRIKGKEDIVPVMNMETGKVTVGKKGADIDTALLLGMAVIFFCTGTAYIFSVKIKRMRTGTVGKQLPGGSVDRLRRKDGKKKHSQKRKGRRK